MAGPGPTFNLESLETHAAESITHERSQKGKEGTEKEGDRDRPVPRPSTGKDPIAG